MIIEPDDHPRIGNDIPNITALSFFSGAMGLDIGMKNGGIGALLACEFNNYCRMTINENNPHIGLIGDITKYDVCPQNMFLELDNLFSPQWEKMPLASQKRCA